MRMVKFGRIRHPELRCLRIYSESKACPYRSESSAADPGLQNVATAAQRYLRDRAGGCGRGGVVGRGRAEGGEEREREERSDGLSNS